MSGRNKAITGALTRRRAAGSGAAALVLSPFIIRTGFAQRPTINIGVIQPLSGANAQSGVNCRNGIEPVSSIGQCNTSCSLLAGVSKAKVFRGR